MDNAVAIKPNTKPVEDTEQLSREDMFVRNLFVCKSIKEAGLQAGYTESYCEGTLRYRLKNPKVQEKIKKAFLASQCMNLPKIAKIYQNGLDHLCKAENIKDYPKLAGIDKRILQITGLLGQDSPHQAPTISIEKVGQMMLNVYQDTTNSGDNNAVKIDVPEIIDITK